MRVNFHYYNSETEFLKLKDENVKGVVSFVGGPTRPAIYLGKTKYTLGDQDIASIIGGKVPADLVAQLAQIGINKGAIESIKSQLANVATKEDLRNIDIALFDVVTKLPASGTKNKIYLVADKTSTDTQNKYTEYAWISEKWEKLGEFTTKVDLSEYAKKSDLTNLATKSEVGSKVDKSELTEYAKKSDLTNLATKSEVDTIDTIAKIAKRNADTNSFEIASINTQLSELRSLEWGGNGFA